MALRLAQAVENRTVDDALWASARGRFDDVEVADLTLVFAFHGLVSPRCLLAFDVPLDETIHGFEEP
jgi:hypothetical protein